MASEPVRSKAMRGGEDLAEQPGRIFDRIVIWPERRGSTKLPLGTRDFSTH
jgi:hypothetical protein